MAERGIPKRWFLHQLLGSALLALGATLLFSATAAADPTFAVMNADGGIYWRSAPDWTTPVAVPGNGFYPGTIIAVHCYQSGAANVPGSSNSMWERVSVASGPGSGSGWVNEHFINDGAAINQPSPGVPPCSGSLPPGQFPAMNAEGGIYWRSAPDWTTPVAVPGNGFYPGTIFAISCYQSGAANVPGSTNSMWERASIAAGPGSGSGWVNEHFVNDGAAINQPSPGIPPCQTSPPTTPQLPPTPSTAGLVFGIVNASGGIYYRNSPHWADTPQQPGVGVYDGDRVQLICGGSGDPVGPYGNTAWSYARNLSRDVGAGWVNEHFINDGAATNHWPGGEPPCGPSTPGYGPASPGGSAPGSDASTSVYFSPDELKKDDPDSIHNAGRIADTELKFSDWAAGSCSTKLVLNNVPASASTLAGWSRGRLGPIYFLDAAKGPQWSRIRRIVLFDPGNSGDFDGNCDQIFDVNTILASWLKSNSANRLIVLTGCASEEKRIRIIGGTPLCVGHSTFHGLWTFYFAGIWNQPFAWQTQVCDYDGTTDHAYTLQDVDLLPDRGCPAGKNLTAWNP